MSDLHKKDREKKLLKPHALEKEDEEENNAGIDVVVLERRLEGLRDTQESVQGLSLWCQTNKRHSSIIIETWLRILRKSPVEKRLTLFYLANDVIQHAKKKNDLTVVNQWAFAVQKATPHVRTPSSVSAAISRIFKIWEERSVYSKDAIADLLSLLNNVPAKDRVVESSRPETYTASAEKVSAFQPSSLISKVKQAYRLKSHLGVTFRSKKYVDMDMESFKTMIKDRSHGMEVVQEVSQYLEQLRTSEAKLSTEVEERRKIVETAEIALVFYENVRGEAKIVNAAYKTFTTRVSSTKEKVDEKIKAFDEMEGTISPVPSPPAVAPSPPPDEEEFGVRPADECGGSYSLSNLPNPTTSYIEVLQNNSKEISADPTSSISDKLIAATTNSMYSTSSASAVNSQHPANPPTPTMSQYDSNQAYQAITSIQQQLQHTWSTSGIVDTYSTMSMSIPNLNFMQQFQQPSMPIMSTGYGGVPLQPPYNLGYETYQPTQPVDHQTSPPLPPQDLSTIPLPPGPNPGPPQPPPLPQEAPPDQPNIYNTAQPPPPPNPFEAEYDPMYPQHSSFQEPTGYDPTSHQYNPQPTTPTDISPKSRYHPYNNNQSPRGRRLSGPPRSQQGSLNNSNTNIYPATNNSSPTGSQMSLSPMERFSQSLKNRSSGMNNKQVPESPINISGEWPALNKDDGPLPNYVQSQNPYFMNNSFNSDYDDGQARQDGLNGSGSDAGSSCSINDPYMLQAANNNPFDISPPPHPSNRGNTHGNMHINNSRGGGGGRGMMMKQMNSRGNPRGGGNRGGMPNSRGFNGGFRGVRGMVRGAGPPRGRGRF